MKMIATEGVLCTSAWSLFNKRAVALESSLQKNLETFKDLIVEAEKIQNELDNCKAELQNQKEKCERKKCYCSESCEKTIQSKNYVIQLAVSIALKISETRNVCLISELLKVLCGDTDTLTPPKESYDNKENFSKTFTPNEKKLLTEGNSSPSKTKKGVSQKKGLDISMEDVSFKDDSVSEIEGTPGRISPIIQSKKLKSTSSISSLSGASTDSRDKKKYSGDWNGPEAKQVKLYFPSPKKKGAGKTSRQSRLTFVASKPSSVVDLTCSPECSGGSRTSQNQICSSENQISTKQTPHILIKKESSDNDDTILPSPTSGPSDITLSKSSIKDSQKFKKPLSLIKVKLEEVDVENSPIIQFVDKKSKSITKDEQLLEDSINILKPNRFPKSPHIPIKVEIPLARLNLPSKGDPPLLTEAQVKMEPPVSPTGEDVTHCEESMSILQCVKKIERGQNSPTKRPLAEIQNIANVPSDPRSTSPPLMQYKEVGKIIQDNKRKGVELVEPVYKEPTVRKRAEKLALPAWCCDECIAFFGTLYKDDPEKVKAVIARCSRHRGRRNPARPKTPPGFWDPRWSVPEDTEEFNRRNNAD